MTDFELRIRITQSLAEVPARDWNMCAGEAVEIVVQPKSELKSTAGDNLCPTLSTRGGASNPFVSHEFLSSLEASRSVGGRTGWQPRHLLAEDASGELVGVVPCYVKMHSRGEYVFDHGWAEAFERAGGSYYPKLQVAVPFTPVTGPRLLARAGLEADAVRCALADALVEVTTAGELSSAHVTFLTKDEWQALGERNFLRRTDQQFHWENADYSSFDDFLAALASRKRKTIRYRGLLAHRFGPDGIHMGCLFRFLHGDRIPKMGPALSDPRVLFDRRRQNARSYSARDGAARRALDRRRDQFHRRRYTVWPKLGRNRAPSLSAFRTLLLSGNRVCDRTSVEAGRSRCARRA
jgi:predicted N-acyltransferase